MSENFEPKESNDIPNEKPSVTANSQAPARKTKSAKKAKPSKSKLGTWLKEIKAEFNKIIWPNRKELLKMTFTVVVTSLFFGVLIAGMDTVFGSIVGILNSLFSVSA